MKKPSDPPDAERLAGGLWCHDVLGVLSGSIDGDVDATTVSAIAAHVAVCDRCARFGAAFAAATGAIRRQLLAAADDGDSGLESILRAVPPVGSS